ncbi:cupin domain-containing protein [Marinobacterium arenosum]|uniref:cupin domain-containing protein n=1 Tax=Marinobacterium arenosum TaxID=2862496 RepID=UPI001C946EBA|nr:cupin domain-containing protein [Marinobacterium arenosum]MBY4678190.1 cupin domain-containing protein [Marinobacterium arenosum]
MSTIQRLTIAPNSELSAAEGTIEGNPMEQLASQYSHSDGATEVGSWFCSAGTLSFDDYPCDEVCFITEGKVGLTDLATGQEQIFTAGDAFICRKGSQLQWTIYEDCRKFFVILS